METPLIEKLKHIKLLILDVDGVMTDGKLYFDGQGETLKAFNSKDGLGIKMLLDNDIHVTIISGRDSDIVRSRAKELGIDTLFLGQHSKIAAFHECLKKYQLTAEQIAYIGDDVNDLPVMKQVAVSVAPADAFEDIKAISAWVSQRNGGDGVVREVCDQLLKAQGKWQQAISTYDNA